MALNKKDRLALIVAGMSLFGSISSSVITVRLAETSDPPPSETCIQILGDYNDEIAAHPSQKQIILHQFLPTDPDAKRCHITATDFP